MNKTNILLSTVVVSLIVQSPFLKASEKLDDYLQQKALEARTHLGPEVKLERYSGWSSTPNSSGEKVQCSLLLGREEKTQKIRYLAVKSNSDVKMGLTLGLLAGVGGMMSEDIKASKKEIMNKAHDQVLTNIAEVLPANAEMEKDALDVANKKASKIVEDDGIIAGIINKNGTPKLSLNYKYSDSFLKKETEVNYKVSVVGFSVTGLNAVAKLDKSDKATELNYTIMAGVDSNMKCVDLKIDETYAPIAKEKVTKDPNEFDVKAAAEALPVIGKAVGQVINEQLGNPLVVESRIEKTHDENFKAPASEATTGKEN